MRGRRPRPLSIAPVDLATLQQVARSESLPWYQVRRARIVLAIARGVRTSTIADQMQCDEATVWRTCRRYEQSGLTGLLAPPRRSGHPDRISPLQRAQIVELACLEPVAKGLHITHWSSEDLARQAVLDGIVPAISARTIRRILNDVDLQPHRTRYWRTARLDAQFKERAEKVLWCYANAERLAKRGIWVVCADEMPNHQVLERRPIRRAIPGSIEQQEFEYTRHGTVNILNFLIVHTGEMEAVCLEANDAEHYIPELERFRRQHRRAPGSLPDPRRRSQPHRRQDGRLLRRLSRLVASPVDAGPRLLAQPGGVAQPRLRPSLPEARVVGESGGVHRPCRGLVAGVQPALRPPLRVDLDESKDATMVR